MMSMTAHDLDRFAAACTVLSRVLLSAPDRAALSRLRDPAVLAHWPVPEGAEDGLALLAASAEGEAEIRADHAALFVGPGPVKAIPYESVHRSDDGLLFEEQTLQVRGAYASLGLEAPRLGKEPDDHLGLELEFVATAFARALELREAGESSEDVERIAASFVREHLQEWAPLVFDLVVDGAETQFYRGIGHLGRAVMAALTSP